MNIEYAMLGAGDEAVLNSVAPGVFDNPVDREAAAAFVAEPHHHMAVARVGGEVIAFVSAVTYLHPDKPLQCWVNELSTAEPFRRRGVALELMRMMTAHARSLGCSMVWVATEGDNHPARSLYRALGGRETEHVAMYEL